MSTTADRNPIVGAAKCPLSPAFPGAQMESRWVHYFGVCQLVETQTTLFGVVWCRPLQTTIPSLAPRNVRCRQRLEGHKWREGGFTISVCVEQSGGNQLGSHRWPAPSSVFLRVASSIMRHRPVRKIHLGKNRLIACTVCIHHE